MPTISVPRDELFASLGKVYSEFYISYSASSLVSIMISTKLY